MTRTVLVTYYRCPCGHIVNNQTDQLGDADINKHLDREIKLNILSFSEGTDANCGFNPSNLAACPECEYRMKEIFPVWNRCLSFCEAKRLGQELYKECKDGSWKRVGKL